MRIIGYLKRKNNRQNFKGLKTRIIGKISTIIYQRLFPTSPTLRVNADLNNYIIIIYTIISECARGRCNIDNYYTCSMDDNTYMYIHIV